MLICYALCNKDRALAQKNLEWIKELGAGKNHSILLVYPDNVQIEKIEAICNEAFESVISYPIDDCITGWPFSANHMWKRAVSYIEHFKLGHFLWMEPDASITRGTAFDEIEAVYEEVVKLGKSFMGFRAGNETTDSHMNGVGVWDRVSELAPSALSAPTPQERADAATAPRMAFDLAGGYEVLMNFHESSLFQFMYRKEDTLDDSLSWLNPQAAIFHTDKKGLLIDLLRGNRVAGEPQTGTLAPRSTPAQSLSKLNCSIYIKTYEKDYKWLDKCLESCAKFCSGFKRIVVESEGNANPVTQKHSSQKLPIAPIELKAKKSDGYLYQQVCKLMCDSVADTDYILTTDSDTLFTMPVTPETYFKDGKPIWLMTPFKEVIEKDKSTAKWRDCMTKFFGIVPAHEYMRRQPFIVPAWLYKAFRLFCEQKHGMEIQDYIMDQEHFSEWNVLGFYAWQYHRECFSWIDTSKDPIPELTVKQYWSRGSMEEQMALPKAAAAPKTASKPEPDPTPGLEQKPIFDPPKIADMVQNGLNVDFAPDSGGSILTALMTGKKAAPTAELTMKEKRQANMAKAREAMAAKRALKNK